jgi:hypothetical protein
MRPHSRRPSTRAGTFVVGAIVALASAAPAAADPPTRTTSTVVVDEPMVSFVCPNGSAVLQTFELTRTITVFYDADGNPIRRVRQARFEGTLYSEDLSRSVPSGGRIHRVEDFVDGTNAITGRLGFARLPGPDASFTGREVVDLETFATIFRAGRPPEEFEAAVCAYLYPDN